MTSRFEAPSYTELVAEQAIVQVEKFQGRLLAEYSDYFFPCQSWREPRGSAVVDFARPFIGDAERVTLDGVLEGLSKTRPGQPINWVDMGGGRALAMRQLGTVPGVASRLKMTNVDLCNFGLKGIKEDEVEFLESLAPGMTRPEAEPTLITDNIETVTLPEPADIITSVEVMQYLNNPLQALSNWYNQLADNGIMLVATEHDWPSWIRYQRELGSPDCDEMPTRHLLEELTRAGINYAVTDESDWQSGFRPDVDLSRFRIMALQKKPGTSIKVTQPVAEVLINPYNFKVAYYEVPATRSTPIVEVVNSDICISLGSATIRNVG